MRYLGFDLYTVLTALTMIKCYQTMAAPITAVVVTLSSFCLMDIFRFGRKESFCLYILKWNLLWFIS